MPIPFGKGDCTVFRKVMSSEDTITEFAPAPRTDAQSRVLLACERPMGHELPDEGGVRVVFDDSIVQGTTSEKRRMWMRRPRGSWTGRSTARSGMGRAGSRAIGMDAEPALSENMGKRKERTWASSDPLARGWWQS